MKRAASILTMYAFVFFLLAEGALGGNCGLLPEACARISGPKTELRCTTQQHGCHPTGCSSTTPDQPVFDAQHSMLTARSACCVIEQTEHHRSAYLYEQHISLDHSRLLSELTDYDPDPHPSSCSRETSSGTEYRVHHSIPVTVLLR